MDTEILVGSTIQRIEKALWDDGVRIKLAVGPLEADLVDAYVLYAKPLTDFGSRAAVIDAVSEKLFAMADKEIRRSISHIQVYDTLAKRSPYSRHIEKLFVYPSAV